MVFAKRDMVNENHLENAPFRKVHHPRVFAVPVQESTVHADMTEAKMKELSLRKQREADIQHSNQLTRGVNNSPKIDELTRTLSRKRDNWNSLLSQERLNLEPIVGGFHAQR